jgi:hypothetical protein
MVAQDVPDRAPKQGIAKQEASHEGQKQPQTQANNDPAPNPIPTAPEPSAPTCDEACQQGRQGLQIQNRLSWLTLGLVIVGGLQVGTMIWQGILLYKTRGDVHTQAEWMEKQAGYMAREGVSLRRQTTLLRKSTDAAEVSARAAMGVAVPTLMLFQCKFETGHRAGQEAFFTSPAVTIKVKNFGQSPAILKRYAIRFSTDFPLEEAEEIEIFTCDSEDAIDPNQVSIIGWEYFNPTTFPKNAVGELISGRSCLVVHGFVEYGDIFGSPAKTLKFCKVLLEYGSIPSNCVASDCDNCRPVDE